LIKVKITHPITTQSGRFEAGQIVEVTDALGNDWIAADKAFKIEDDVIEVTELAQEVPHFIEGVKTKKVKHADR
jgi:hypothetical protein